MAHAVGGGILALVPGVCVWSPGLREGDTIARVGGDEFVVSLPDIDSDADLSQIARKLLDAIVLPIEAAGHELHLTASIGIALYPEHGRDVVTLLRWPNAHGAWISPVEFIPVAEESGLIVPLGEWALNEACSQLRRWREHGLRNLTLAVNLSAR